MCAHAEDAAPAAAKEEAQGQPEMKEIHETKVAEVPEAAVDIAAADVLTKAKSAKQVRKHQKPL